MMISGVGSDLISDITTNIIRGPVIQYTNDICDAYGVDTSFFALRRDQAIWSTDEREWVHPDVRLPVANGRALILVPKAIVRAKVDADSYFSDYLMPFIAERELENPQSEFVRVLKDGRRLPMRGAIRERYGAKESVADLLVGDERLYGKYRSAVNMGDPTQSHEESIRNAVGASPPDLDALLAGVLARYRSSQRVRARHGSALGSHVSPPYFSLQNLNNHKMKDGSASIYCGQTPRPQGFSIGLRLSARPITSWPSTRITHRKLGMRNLISSPGALGLQKHVWISHMPEHRQ